MPRFRIGIDLGTTNCALAAVAVVDPTGKSQILEIPQQQSAQTRGQWATLPSFIYLPPEENLDTRWIPGRWARNRAAETPGRVVHSAKSWLGHHAVDRRAAFLPFGTTDLPTPQQLSPVQALSHLLSALASAWNQRYPDAAFSEQEIAVTVPASFDPVAQQLTLEAAALAGFPETTVLLEEPQAAFYAWQENEADADSPLTAITPGQPRHVLVADLGGGTTDFSLFALESATESRPAQLKRIAVSEHILLGGDNLDLALAHHVEKQLTPGVDLPGTAFAQLLARCREIKEDVLAQALGNPDDVVLQKSWPVAIARPGASLLSGTVRGNLSGADVVHLLIEGYFPHVNKTERPVRTVGGLREMGLPYAKDPAITRHLADFLRDRPRVDYLLCNGGLTKSPAVRARLLQNLAGWQCGEAPQLLTNADPDLAVARGAARFLHLRAAGDSARIEAGASRGFYLGLGERKALCVLPMGTPADTGVRVDPPALRALLGRSVAFPLFSHTRRNSDLEGSIVSVDEDGFTELPPIEAFLSPPNGYKAPKDPSVRVSLRSTLRSTGLLRIEVLTAEPSLGWSRTWPLEFSLRGTAETPRNAVALNARMTPASEKGSGGAHALTAQGAAALVTRFRQGSSAKDKLTANAAFSVAEKAIGIPKANWNAAMVRSLFDAWKELERSRKSSPDHEEAWFHLAGYLLRPGTGVPGDSVRMETLWPILTSAPYSPRNSVKIQRWICARRIAAGLDSEQTLQLWTLVSAEWPANTSPSAEVALLAGALEKLPVVVRTELSARMTAHLQSKPNDGAAWKALGRLLARGLFHAGPEHVVPPESVTQAWQELRNAAPSDSVRTDMMQTWLRAARRTGVRALDVPSSCREQIDDALRKGNVTEARRRSLHDVMPITATDVTSMLGDGLPPGLSLTSLD